MKNSDLLRFIGKSKESGENSLPLYANRGVSTTNSLENPLFNVCIDWLTVSFNYDYDSYSRLFKFMGLSPSDYVEQRGVFNVQYSYMRIYKEHIKVYLPEKYDEDEMSRCCMELSGQACRLLETLNGGISFWILLCCMIHSLNGTCSRCDLAIDDFNGKYFTIHDLFQKVMKGEYVCSSNLWNVVAKGTRTDEEYTDTGFTIYLGSTSSERQLCIYNKKSERKVNGYESFVDYWVRYELRFKKDTANSLFKDYLINDEFWEDFSGQVASLLLGYVEFKDHIVVNDDSHRYESPSWEPWLSFLGTTSKIKVINQAKLESTIQVKKTWYQANYSNFMNEIALSDLKGFNKYMDDTLLDRLNDFDFDKKRLDRVNNYRLMSGQKELTSLEFFSYINDLRIKNNLPELSKEDKSKWIYKLFDEEVRNIYE